MGATTLDIPPLGAVVFSQSKRAKRISISVAPFKPVRVAYPAGVSFKKAHKYLIENMDWAKKSLEKMRQVEQQHRAACGSQRIISRARAKAFLKKRLHELADKHGFEYNKVFIKNQKTRWGSCSERNNINLNVNLVSLSEELRDYVLLHELVHTRIKNHSKEYWAQLDKHIDGAKDLHKTLKKHKPGWGE